VASLPAWLEHDGPLEDPWCFVARHAAARDVDELVRRARWLGLPVAVAGPPPSPTPPWLRLAMRGTRSPSAAGRRCLVVDLSSLWAGPLCSHLLGLAGARVVKVESAQRPDGARRGDARFFDLLNADKASVALDLRDAHGRSRLRALLERVDVVIESARPRALAQLGVDAETFVASRPGRTWLSITGYGRGDPEPGRVAFGDDAAVAAGLARATGRGAGSPLFCGDAIADPLAGLHAALAARASQVAGGGHLLDVSLRDVVAHAAAFAGDAEGAVVRRDGGDFSVDAPGGSARVAPPRARRAARRARPLGADTEAVCRELAC
jgi:crotonobetainyl-CoA:carnitine CoA-transferase CaiB-like acyl-CoA transferase